MKLSGVLSASFERTDKELLAHLEGATSHAGACLQGLVYRVWGHTVKLVSNSPGMCRERLHVTYLQYPHEDALAALVAKVLAAWDLELTRSHSRQSCFRWVPAASAQDNMLILACRRCGGRGEQFGRDCDCGAGAARQDRGRQRRRLARGRQPQARSCRGWREVLGLLSA